MTRMADELDVEVIGDAFYNDDGACPELAAAFRRAHDGQVTYLTEAGCRFAAIVPHAGDAEHGYSEFEAAVAEFARLQGPYQRALARVRDLMAQENTSLKG
jgi:hypothetical protein